MWEGIVAITVALAGVIGAWLRRAHRRDKPRQAIRDRGPIYEALGRVRHEVGATRAIIVRTHNGGGLPSARTPLYSSGLYEVIGDDVRLIRKDWDRIPVDEEYVGVLNRLIEGGDLTIDVRELDAGSTLYDIYSLSATKTVQKIYLAHDERALYYLSLHWSSVDHQPGPAARIAIRAATSRLRSLIKDA